MGAASSEGVEISFHDRWGGFGLRGISSLSEIWKLTQINRRRKSRIVYNIWVVILISDETAFSSKDSH